MFTQKRCACEARFIPGREARRNGQSPKDAAGVRRNQRESEEKKNRDARQHIQKLLQKRPLGEAVGFLELLLGERIP
jgi:hypothetical protein